MIADLGHWLLSVTAAALLMGVIQMMMPPGPVRAVGALGCSLLLFLTLTAPVLELRYDAFLAAVEDYTRQTRQLQQELEQESAALKQSIIARRSVAYSEDVTAGLEAEVELLWTQGQPPHLTGAVVTGRLSRQAQQALCQRLQAELGLREEQITLNTTEEVP